MSDALTTNEIYKTVYPATLLTDIQIDTYANVASAAIESYCNRNFIKQDYNEWHIVDVDSNSVLLDQYPVNAVYGVIVDQAVYGSFNISNANSQILTVAVNDDSIDFYKNFTALTSLTKADYSNYFEVANAVSNTLDSYSMTYTEQSNAQYTSAPSSFVLDATIRQGGQSMIIDIIGVDFTQQINYKLERDRQLHFGYNLSRGVNKVLIKYNAGYILPSGTSYGTLPLEINDICNRLIKESTDYDAVHKWNINIAAEGLGDANYRLSEHAYNSTYIRGILDQFKSQLDKYRIKTIAYY